MKNGSCYEVLLQVARVTVDLLDRLFGQSCFQETLSEQELLHHHPPMSTTPITGERYHIAPARPRRYIQLGTTEYPLAMHFTSGHVGYDQQIVRANASDDGEPISCGIREYVQSIMQCDLL